jgi:hypothetical protein
VAGRFAITATVARRSSIRRAAADVRVVDGIREVVIVRQLVVVVIVRPVATMVVGVRPAGLVSRRCRILRSRRIQVVRAQVARAIRVAPSETRP